MVQEKDWSPYSSCSAVGENQESEAPKAPGSVDLAFLRVFLQSGVRGERLSS